MVRTRFAPSPTGLLHVGSLRTALFTYLFAKKQNGKFLLRIEDTDKERSVEGGVENIITSIKWAGLTVDEGVDLNQGRQIIERGDFGPYIQSARLALYKKYVQELIQKDGGYYCFCSQERLDELRKNQVVNKQPSGYDGHCRNLSSKEIQARLESLEKFKSLKSPKSQQYVIRLKMPKKGSTTWNDLVRREVTFENNLVDDQVLMKSDGFPTYHFAVVIDDHLMQVTHVIRGEEWISSTPKHLALYNFFGWTPPTFGHLSLLVNEKKQKLSKRQGDVSVEDFKKKGYLPEALVNFIAFLGWNPGDQRELFTLSELAKEFDFNQVSKAAAVFNLEKLNWYNKQYLMNLPLEEVTRRATPFFVAERLIKEIGDKEFNWLMQVIDLERGRASTLAELVEGVKFIFAKTLIFEPELLLWKNSTIEQTKIILKNLVEFLENFGSGEWGEEYLENATRTWMQAKKLTVGEVLWPMRVALSGQKNSPGPFQIAAVLGKEKTLERLRLAIKN